MKKVLFGAIALAFALVAGNTAASAQSLGPGSGCSEGGVCAAMCRQSANVAKYGGYDRCRAHFAPINLARQRSQCAGGSSDPRCSKFR